ncbi:hypothetical protein [Sphingomonas dokdonensis]|uniref:Uncharacterized protein n=1 Tax=Sphingomonas dokdonensis TaxID=344880 RepID=A0A245ZNI7_9SPHN|nr:hypothetical protein [Sphingomonas dokdonensis]OWK31296.1 hypothetical protein SPDO_13030 [Sphingomonas dokdonensis]
MSGAALGGCTDVVGGGGGGAAVIERADWANAGTPAIAVEAAISIEMVLRNGPSCNCLFPNHWASLSVSVRK